LHKLKLQNRNDKSFQVRQLRYYRILFQLKVKELTLLFNKKKLRTGKMKNKYNKLLLILTLMILSISAFADEDNTVKSSILIFNFNYLAPGADETIASKDGSIKKFQYYSFIIPQTLSKNINSEGIYISSRKYDTHKINDTFQDEEERISHIRELVKISADNSADYLVSGDCSIEDGTLIVSVTVFNAKGYDITTFQHRSSELGVLFKDTTDSISHEIINQITAMAALDKKRFRPSPFIPAHNFLKNLSIGVDAGYLFIQKPWSDFYNDAYFATPYIMLNINNWLAFSIKYDYIQSDSEGKNFTERYEADFQGGSINAHLRYNLTEKASFVFSGGGGIMETTIIMDPDAPLMLPGMEMSSKDPYLDTSLYAAYRFSTLEIKAGIIYKRIFSKGEHVEMSGIYAGLGILF